MRPISISLLCTVAVMMFGHAASGLAEIPVEGDRQMLMHLHDVQVANLSRYPKGRLAETYRFVEGGKVKWDGNAEVVWNGENRYYKLDYLREESRQRIVREVLYGKNAVVFWDAANRTLERQLEGKAKHDLTLENLHPSGSWFTMNPQVFDRTWAWFTDLTDEERWAPNPPIIVVQPQQGNTVVIEWRFPQGLVMEVEFSLALGGNIVRFQRKPGNPPGDAYSYELGTYDWVSDGQDGFRLSKLTWASAQGSGHPDEVYREVDLQIQSFDCQAAIPADRFTEASLHLPEGIRIVDRGRTWSRETRRGGPRGEDLNTKLDRLAEDAGSRGFSAPK